LLFRKCRGRYCRVSRQATQGFLSGERAIAHCER
jgi:hypothetical protein